MEQSVLLIFIENSVTLSATAGTGGSPRRADPNWKRRRYQLARERNLAYRDDGDTFRGSATKVHTSAELHHGDRSADREDAAAELPAERAEDRERAGGEQRAAETGVATAAAGLRDRPGGNEPERRADVARSRRDPRAVGATARRNEYWQ